jgi:hypothetical protein
MISVFLDCSSCKRVFDRFLVSATLLARKTSPYESNRDLMEHGFNTNKRKLQTVCVVDEHSKALYVLDYKNR